MHIVLFIGGPEIIFILLIVLLLFGSRKIPEFAKGLGKGLNEFRKATDDIKKEINREADNLKKDVNDLKDNITDETKE